MYLFSRKQERSDTTGLKVQGTLHWVSVAQAISVEVREYDRLFKVEDPSSEEGDFKDYINPDSLKVIGTAYAEPAVKTARFEERYQFLRKGYFCLDKDTSEERMVFNRTVTLKDAWAKEKEEGSSITLILLKSLNNKCQAHRLDIFLLFVPDLPLALRLPVLNLHRSTRWSPTTFYNSFHIHCSRRCHVNSP